MTMLGLADASRCAVKRITRQDDGSISSTDYDRGFEWWFRPYDAGDDFDKMARLLRRLARAQRLIACMGDLKPGLDLSVPHQRLWARNDANENTMVEAPRAWLAIDVDDASVPPGLGAPELYVEAAIFIRDHGLPEEFHGVTMIVSATARPGLRGRALLRARLWFLLDRAYPLPVLKTWTRGLKAIHGVGDSSVCRVGQPIYLGRPIFINMSDPIPPQMWAALVRERKDRVQLIVDRFAEKVAAIERKLERVAKEMRIVDPIAGGEHHNWRGFLEAAVGGELSFFEPLSMGLGLAARSPDTHETVIAFTLKLIAERADKGRISQYDSEWIGRSLNRFRDRDRSLRDKREAMLARLYGGDPA
jgi:hypothetical protein